MYVISHTVGQTISRRTFARRAGALAAGLLLAVSGADLCASTRVVLLGTSGGPTWWPDSLRMGTASALVVKDNTTNHTDHIYLIDLGPGSAQRLGQAFNSGTYTNIDGDNVLKGYSSFLRNVKSLFFTHLHMDHTTDFPTLLLCGQGAGMVPYPDGEADKRLQVFGPGTRGQVEDVYPAGRTNAAPLLNPTNPTPGTVEMTQYLLQAYAQTINNMTQDTGWGDFSKLVSVHDIPLPPLPRDDYPIDPATGRSRNTAPWPNMDPIPVYQDSLVTVTATLVNHGPVYGSFAFRFDTADGAVVFAGDTGYPCTNLIQLAQGADVLVHEVIDPAFINNLFPEPLTPGAAAMKYHLESSHTSIFDVGKQATAAGVRTLVLNHIVPGNTPEARLQKAQANFAGRVIIGADLMEIDVGASTGNMNSVAADYDGDQASDMAVFDSNTGFWYIKTLSNRILAWALLWGGPGAVPVCGDFDGDQVSDPAVFDSNTGAWYIKTMTGTILAWALPWGQPGALPVRGDYNGDGSSDLAVFDAGTGCWYIKTLAGNVLAWAIPWGWPGAVPVSGDYDGDSVSDLAVFDSNTGCWYVRNLAGTVIAWATAWGFPGAIPGAGDYSGSDTSDMAAFDSNTGCWYVRSVSGTIRVWGMLWGWPGATPAAGDYNGDGVTDLAVFDSNTGHWYIADTAGAIILWAGLWGWPGAVPVSGMR